jgi:hypothetical protein
MSQKKRYEWVFLYWMPYDNNLSRWQKPILKMIQAGVEEPNLLVVVEAKTRTERTLSRYLFTQGRVRASSLEATNSGSIKVFADYLSWAQSQFEAEKWAIVFLGHGGTLDELSPDENPGLYRAPWPKWLNIQEISTVIKEFDDAVKGRIELLFLQNCCKGTIEAHYTFRDAARYTLSSQTVLGAPNYYYQPLFQFLAKHPDLDGAQVAEKIMMFEQDNMYDGYTLTDNAQLKELPHKLNPLIESLLAANPPQIARQHFTPHSHRCMNEDYVDALAFFTLLTNIYGIEPQHFRAFEAFYQKKLVYRFQQSPLSKYPHYSALSLLLPFSKKHLSKYLYLPVFADLPLPALYDRIFFGGETEKATPP